jgi:hypothetical protein
MRRHVWIAFVLVGAACGSSNQEPAQPGSGGSGSGSAGSGSSVAAGSGSGSGSAAPSVPAIKLATPEDTAKTLLAVWMHGDPELLAKLYPEKADIEGLTDCKDPQTSARLAAELAAHQERLEAAPASKFVRWAADPEEKQPKGKKAGTCTVLVDFARVQGKLTYTLGADERTLVVDLVKIGNDWRVAHLDHPLAVKKGSPDGVAIQLLGAIKVADKAALKALYLTPAQVDAAWKGCAVEQKKIIADELAAFEKNLKADPDVTLGSMRWRETSRKALGKDGKLNACIALRDVTVVGGDLEYEAIVKGKSSTRSLQVTLVKVGDAWAVAHGELK